MREPITVGQFRDALQDQIRHLNAVKSRTVDRVFDAFPHLPAADRATLAVLFCEPLDEAIRELDACIDKVEAGQ